LEAEGFRCSTGGSGVSAAAGRRSGQVDRKRDFSLTKFSWEDKKANKEMSAVVRDRIQKEWAGHLNARPI